MDRPRPRRPFYKRALFWVPVSLVVLLVIARLLLDPIATWATRKGLSRMQGFRGELARVHIKLIPLRYIVREIKIWELPERKGKAPILYARYVEAGLPWKDLLRFRLAGVARIEDAKAVIRMTREVTPKDIVVKKVKEKIPPPLQIDDALRNLIPFRIDRLELLRGEALVIDTKIEGNPVMWIHDLQATLENFATRDRLTGGKPTTVALRGKLQRSGELSAYISADLLADKLTFAGQARVEHFDLRELHEWLKSLSDLTLEQGTFEAFTTFECKRGEIKGGVKPVLTNVEVKAAKKGLGPKIKELLADAAVKLVSDRVPGRDAIATLIPFHGSIENPKIQVWPAIIATIRNAFVEGLSSSFENLPVPEAGKKEGVLKQAERGLNPKSHPHTKAQPSGGTPVKK